MKAVLKKTTEELLKIMGFKGEVNLEEDESGLLRVNIETDEAPFLIGQAGANLLCFQQILTRIMNKKAEENYFFTLDVNNYRKHKIELLRELAQNTAERVLIDGRSFFLQPMNAFERRIIHMTLANYQELSTQSQGEEPNRRVIVTPRNII